MARAHLPPPSERGGFEAMYQGPAPPPWDIGRAQGVFVSLVKARAVEGPVLDVGCGTGENVLFMASRGLEAWGVDGAPTAVARAREKARERRLKAHFVEGSVLDLGMLDRSFKTVIDSGLFHTLSDGQRPKFERALHGAIDKGGHYYMLCFSENEPGDWGPRRVTQDEVRATFHAGWTVEAIEPAVFEDTDAGAAGPRAWFCRIRRD